MKKVAKHKVTRELQRLHSLSHKQPYLEIIEVNHDIADALPYRGEKRKNAAPVIAAAEPVVPPAPEPKAPKAVKKNKSKKPVTAPDPISLGSELDGLLDGLDD